MNEKLKTYLKTLTHSKVLFDYLQMQENGIEELIDNAKTGKMDAMEKKYLGENYFIYKFIQRSGIGNKGIVDKATNMYFDYIHNKVKYLHSTNQNIDFSVAEIIADAEEVLKLIFEGGENE